MKTKLLIVDDSFMMRSAIQHNLSDFQLDVVGMAGNGLKALEIVKEKSPDIVTLDITMPEMDGIACLEEILKIAPRTKVVIITALKDKLTGLRALDMGAARVINKPLNEVKLKEMFEKLLNF